MTGELRVVPVGGLPEITPGDDLAGLVVEAAAAAGAVDHDCIVVTQKVVSKAEGRIVELAEPYEAARRDLIEAEAVRILRRRGDLVIAETEHGFVCANAGVDLSNVAEGTAALLPEDPDRSARRIRDTFRGRELEVAVIVSDTFGRPWREGVCDVAIGVAGLRPVVDLRGTADGLGRPLEVTEVAVADEIAAAADLVMGKARRVPAAIVRGLEPAWFGRGSSRDLVRSPVDDLFR